MGYLYLVIAIISEVVGTTALQAANGFTRLAPSCLVVVGYGLSFYFLSHVLRYFTLGVTYAIWSGTGIVLIGIIGAVVYKQTPDLPAIFGMGLIVAGVAVINLFSKTVGH